MRLDERLQAEVERFVDQAREGAPRMQDGEQQHGIGTLGAQQAELPPIDDELLREDGHADRAADDRHVLDRPTERVRLAQHGDRRRTAGLVGAGTRDDVLGFARRWSRPTASGA